jgi:hypothetical protein
MSGFDFGGSANEHPAASAPPIHKSAAPTRRRFRSMVHLRRYEMPGLLYSVAQQSIQQPRAFNRNRKTQRGDESGGGDKSRRLAAMPHGRWMSLF